MTTKRFVVEMSETTWRQYVINANSEDDALRRIEKATDAERQYLLVDETTSIDGMTAYESDDNLTYNIPHAFIEEEEQLGFCRCGEPKAHPIHVEE